MSTEAMQQPSDARRTVRERHKGFECLNVFPTTANQALCLTIASRSLQ
jgi:hypothetical protein